MRVAILVVLLSFAGLLSANRSKKDENHHHKQGKHHHKKNRHHFVQRIIKELKSENITRYDPSGSSKICKDLNCPPSAICILDTGSDNAICVPIKIIRKSLKHHVRLEDVLKKKKYLKKELKKYRKKMKRIKTLKGIAMKKKNKDSMKKKKNDYQNHLRQFVNDYKHQSETNPKQIKTNRANKKKKEKHQKKNKDGASHHKKKNGKKMKKPKKSMKKELPPKKLDKMAERMVNWFHVLMEDDKKKAADEGTSTQEITAVLKPPHKGHKNGHHHKKNKKHKGKKHHSRKHKKGKHHHIEKRIKRKANKSVKTVKSQPNCLVEVNWMFGQLDKKGNGKITDKEMDKGGLKSNIFEKDFDLFFKSCDKDNDTALTHKEWCDCFLNVEPPCYKTLSNVPSILVRGKPQPLIGAYVPQCDKYGYYKNLQCHGSTGYCWCVDVYGKEINGTRGRGDIKC